MSITLDGNGNSVPPERPRPPEMSEAETIVRLLYGCPASREDNTVILHMHLSLWHRLQAEAVKTL